MTIADACLVTSVRDGMNLTSHEFVVCQQDSPAPAPVILSEFTGTAGCFSSALQVNPWNYTVPVQCRAMTPPHGPPARC